MADFFFRKCVYTYVGGQTVINIFKENPTFCGNETVLL